MQRRLAGAHLRARQGHDEPTGQAKITPAFNLPSTWVLHTVGPVVRGGEPSERDCELLASSYRTCLELAFERGLRSVAFCCISTGEFGFPQREAARIAVRTVHDGLNAHRGRQGADCGQQGTRHGQKDAGSGTTDGMKVVFDVFTASDERIYQELLA